MGENPLEGWDEADIVLISALEHWSYCPRQCALIHLEQVFDENIYTLRGRMLHERADEGGCSVEAGSRIERGLPLWSKRLGLIGKADIVEFRGTVPFPIEYKHGPKRSWGHEDLQLCAQAICLEEMTGQQVPRGAIYHHGSRRRREVVLDEPLRARMEEAVVQVRSMLHARKLPAPVNDHRCPNCSLIESCLPGVIARRDRFQVLAEDLFRIRDG